MRYAIIPTADNSKLPERLAQLELPTYDELAPSVYFVVFDGSANALKKAVGIGDGGDAGDGVILKVSSSAGYTYRSLWHWLDEHQEE